MYKTKDTAIRHIHAGENFENKTFQMFWRDREVYTAALNRRPEYFSFVIIENIEILWDEKFIEEFFLSLLDRGATLGVMRNFGEYLPPSITDSKDVVLRASRCDDSFWLSSHMHPDLTRDEEIKIAYRLQNRFDDNRKLDPFTSTMLMEKKRALLDLIASCPSIYASLPDELRRVREVCLLMCRWKRNLRLALDGLHDDEEFIFDVLKYADKDYYAPQFLREVLETASLRIRKSCKDVGLMVYLEKTVAAKKLSEQLNQKQFHLQHKSPAMKI
jgi:hypothetical protein